MGKITEQDFIQNYEKYRGCQTKLASHYKLSERSIRNYKTKYIKSVKPVIDIEELNKLYCLELKTVVYIADYFKVSRDTIYKALKQHNISRVSKYNINDVRKAYEERNANISELSKLFNIANRATIKKLLKDHNIVNSTKEAITDLYKAGLSVAEIARELKLSDEVIEYNLKHHSIYREKPINIEESELQKFRDSMTLNELAKKYSCSTRTISAYIAKFSLARKSNVKYLFDINTVSKLYTEDNLTMDEIADIFGCCRKTINDFIRDNGIISTNKETRIERFIRELLTALELEYVQNSRKIIKPLELDFYIPAYNIAIEVCGLYWHSTKVNKDKKHIRHKYDLCKDNNIQLITIFEDEILEKPDIVINRLTNIFHRNKSKIYARNCKIKVIDKAEGIAFLKQYHIQGSGRNNIYIGAFYNNNLISVMSFSSNNPAKGQSCNTVELNRFVNPFSAVGIASKLFKFYLRTYKPAKVISYSDNRWNIGNLYSTLKFIKVRDTKFNYWYVVKQQRKHRFAFTKQRLLSLFPGSSESNTEEEIAEKHNLYRIYDCGSTVWEFTAV